MLHLHTSIIKMSLSANYRDRIFRRKTTTKKALNSHLPRKKRKNNISAAFIQILITEIMVSISIFCVVIFNSQSNIMHIAWSIAFMNNHILKSTYKTSLNEGTIAHSVLCFLLSTFDNHGWLYSLILNIHYLDSVRILQHILCKAVV